MPLRRFHELSMWERSLLMQGLSHIAEREDATEAEIKIATQLNKEIHRFPVLIDIEDDPESDWYEEVT